MVACEIEPFMRDFALPYFERAGVSDKVMRPRAVLASQQMHLQGSCLMPSVWRQLLNVSPGLESCCRVLRGLLTLGGPVSPSTDQPFAHGRGHA